MANVLQHGELLPWQKNIGLWRKDRFLVDNVSHEAASFLMFHLVDRVNDSLLPLKHEYAAIIDLDFVSLLNVFGFQHPTKAT